eukprot:scaffold2238_cov76-Cyclotella_meneghiniana.AAC.1
MAWVVTVQVLVALLHFTLYSLLLIGSLLYYDLPRLGVPPDRRVGVNAFHVENAELSQIDPSNPSYGAVFGDRIEMRLIHLSGFVLKLDIDEVRANGSYSCETIL